MWSQTELPLSTGQMFTTVVHTSDLAKNVLNVKAVEWWQRVGEHGKRKAVKQNNSQQTKSTLIIEMNEHQNGSGYRNKKNWGTLLHPSQAKCANKTRQ